jgi:hypothetical protein
MVVFGVEMSFRSLFCPSIKKVEKSGSTGDGAPQSRRVAAAVEQYGFGGPHLLERQKW